MKILFVNPETPDTFWNLKYALKFISKKAVLPPLGLLTVAAMLPEDWEKKLVDMAIEPLRDKDILWADFVFIGGMFIQKESAQKVISRCNHLKTKVVAGGPLFIGAEDYFEGIDHIILNEAEITLPAFLEDLQNGKPKYIYRTEQWADMTKTPVPLWNLIYMKKYALMSIQCTRGCPFSCDFCNVTALFGNKMRIKSTEQILAELESLYVKGWSGPVFIADDNFIGNKQRVKNDILPALIDWMKKRKYPFALNTQVSINIAKDKELMQLMVKAGFTTVFIGIESPDEDVLAECQKSQNTNQDLIASVKKIQACGLQVQGGFILGFDSDKHLIFDKMISFIQESGIVTAMVGLLNAPRGTKLYKRLVSENRLLKDSSGSNTDFSINFIPRMNLEALVDGYKKVVTTIYSPVNYYNRIKTLLKNYKPLQIKKEHLKISDIVILLKSSLYLGLLEKGRIHYWRLVLWSLLKHPKMFHVSINLAIYGFHFRKTFSSY